MEDSFKTGDIIKARVNKIPFLFHLGIIVTDNDLVSIWHCTPNGFNETGGSVRKTLLTDWLKTRTLLSVEQTNLTKEHIERTAAALYKRKFNYITFNCEHFVYFIRDGKEKSPQLRFFTAFFLASISGIYIFYRKRTYN